MIRPALLSTVILLAGCARSEEARYAQPDNALPASANISDDEDDDVTVGNWRTALDGEQPVVEYGPSGAPNLFSLSCDERRNLLLQRPGAAPPGDLPNLLVTVGSETRRLAVVGTSGANPGLRGTLATNDPFVRVLTGAATRIVVRLGDAPPLVMPPSPLIATYVQQCAAGEARPALPSAGNSVEANGVVEVTGGNAATTNAQ
ncbi:MAG TPA: hypothetical protein VMG08_08015 [Allosphingosinicella sp.]|nr:hypothetical protein [Allosphingosinicella sp.]